MTEPSFCPPRGAARELRLADLGALAGPLVHEFNNFLNSWSLHLALLQQLTPQFAAELQGLKQQMHPITALLGQFQRYSSGDPQAAETDLLVAARKALDILKQTPRGGPDGIGVQLTESGAGDDETVSLALEFPADLPHVLGHEADLQRLCRFLIRNAARAALLGTKDVVIRTTVNQGKVLLTVEDGGPNVAAEALPSLFRAKAKGQGNILRPRNGCLPVDCASIERTA